MTVSVATALLSTHYRCEPYSRGSSLRWSPSGRVQEACHTDFPLTSFLFDFRIQEELYPRNFCHYKNQNTVSQPSLHLRCNSDKHMPGDWPRDRGWGDGSIGNILATQAWRPEFKFLILMLKKKKKKDRCSNMCLQFQHWRWERPTS